jgi:hypothetical protein
VAGDGRQRSGQAISGSANTAAGAGHGWPTPHGICGVLYISAQATVYLGAYTVANIINNIASTTDPNIHGQYRSIS